MRIVYCLNSIREIGGTERITMTKANALAQIPGNKVWIIVTEKFGDRNALALSPEVMYMTLNVHYHNNNYTGLRYYATIAHKKRQHKKALQQILCEIRPDVVLSAGDEFSFLPSVKKQCWKIGVRFAIIRELHHSKAMALDFYSRHHLGRFIEYMRYLYRYYYSARQYDRIIALTYEDKDEFWKNYDNMSVIPNPLTFRSDFVSSLDSKKVIALGRLTDQKNFPSLIRAFHLVAVQYPDWTLEIYGEGDQRQMLQDLVDSFHMDKNILLKGVTSQVAEKLSQASCFVLSSMYEGWGLVITEAMSCGLPVVSYACPCGPKDIITDGVDGFLVPTNDEKMLAEKIIWIIEHPQERKIMGGGARKTASKYDIDKIIPMWMDLFERLAVHK